MSRFLSGSANPASGAAAGDLGCDRPGAPPVANLRSTSITMSGEPQIMSVTHHSHMSMSDITRLERQEKREYRRVFVLCFLLFLVIAAVSRVLPRSWRPLSATGSAHESIFAEARRTAYTVLPFAFSQGV